MPDTYTYSFPFSQVPKGSKVVIYGAGLVGRDYLAQILQSNYCIVVYIADRNHEVIQELYGIKVYAPQNLSKTDEYDYVVVASHSYTDSMLISLGSMEIPESKIISILRMEGQHYATDAEDVVVKTIFNFLGKKRFSYIDIGANDPLEASNTAYLYNNGCRGICVEPNPDFIDELKKHRPEDTILNVGVAAEAGTLSYHMYENNSYNTFSENAVRHREINKVKPTGVCEVQVMTLSQIIEEYSNGVYPDFLQIDIESMDYDVLNSCDFNKSSPTVICVEAGDWNAKEMNTMLGLKGFFPFHRTVSNMIYLNKSVKKRYSSIAELTSKAK